MTKWWLRELIATAFIGRKEGVITVGRSKEQKLM
jgi:hypothetical protein